MLVSTMPWREKFFSVYAYLGFLTPVGFGYFFFPPNWKVLLYNFIEEVSFPITICLSSLLYPLTVSQSSFASLFSLLMCEYSV